MAVRSQQSEISKRASDQAWQLLGGAAFYENQAEADKAFETTDNHFAKLPDFTESWHAVLCPIRFSGVTNWFSQAGIDLRVTTPDPGGPVAVLTSAGYDPGGPDNMPRILDFLDKVDQVRDWYDSLDENVLNGNFQIVNPDSDGMTFSIWKDDAAMMTAAYGAGGLHRGFLDQQKSEKLADRTSYLRARITRHKGAWNGREPVALNVAQTGS